MFALSSRHWQPTVKMLLLLIVAACCLLLLTSYGIAIFSHNQYRNDDLSIHDLFERHNMSHTKGPLLKPSWCSGLNGMLQGHWEPVVMTTDDTQRIKAFLNIVRQRQFGMPDGLQREDKRCGNLTFDPRPGHNLELFRALCDPESAAPCCDSSNTCVARAVEECRCDGCLDMRTELHAEYATWRTAQPGCELQDMTAGELCDLLEGGTFFFIGDSLVRHVYTAMLLAVRDNEETGAFGENMPAETQLQCRNMYMFTEKVCRLYLATKVRACNDRVLVRHVPSTYNNQGPDIRSEIRKLKNQTRSAVVLGIGLHGGLKAQETFEKVLRPLLEQMRQEAWRWPIIIWASVHCFGPLKGPNTKRQQNTDVILFNRQMEELLAPYTASLPLYVFHTFNLTAPVTSFDGCHFGLGVNKVKVKVLLNFLRRLKHDGVW